MERLIGGQTIDQLADRVAHPMPEAERRFLLRRQEELKLRVTQ